MNLKLLGLEGEVKLKITLPLAEVEGVLRHLT